MRSHSLGIPTWLPPRVQGEHIILPPACVPTACPSHSPRAPTWTRLACACLEVPACFHPGGFPLAAPFAGTFYPKCPYSSLPHSCRCLRPSSERSSLAGHVGRCVPPHPPPCITVSPSDCPDLSPPEGAFRDSGDFMCVLCCFHLPRIQCVLDSAWMIPGLLGSGSRDVLLFRDFHFLGSSLVVQWLGFGAFTAGAWV